MKKWKVGLIGCGGMATFYRDIYRNMPGVELDYVVALTEEEARRTAEELGVKHYSMHYEDCLNSDVDIVDISTPNHLHKEQFLAALKAGKHILLQKPIAPDLEDAREILEAAQMSDLKTGMFMSKRCIGAYHEMKRMIQAGVIGQVASVHTRAALIRRPGAINAENWRNSLKMTGGGALIQLGIHDYDLLQWILEEKIVSISAFSDNLMSPHIGGDDMTQSIVRFQSGIMGSVEASYCSTQPFLEIYGREGVLTYKNGKLIIKASHIYESEVIMYDSPGIEKAFDMPSDNQILFCLDNPYEQHVMFLKAVMNDESVPVSIMEGYDALLIVKAAYESAQTGKTVYIDEMKAKVGGNCEED